MKRSILSEKNIVVILFVLVCIIFSFAQQDTKQIEENFPATISSSVNANDANNSSGNTTENQPDKVKQVITVVPIR